MLTFQLDNYSYTTSFFHLITFLRGSTATFSFIQKVFHIHKEIYTCDNQLYQKQNGKVIAKHRTKIYTKAIEKLWFSLNVLPILSIIFQILLDTKMHYTKNKLHPSLYTSEVTFSSDRLEFILLYLLTIFIVNGVFSLVAFIFSTFFTIYFWIIGNWYLLYSIPLSIE